MPIFEYRCNACGENFETLVLKKDEKVTCPKCESSKVERQLSGFAVGGGGSLSSIGQASSPGCGSGGFS